MPIEDFYAAIEGGRRGQQQTLDNQFRQRQEQRAARLDTERSNNDALQNVLNVLKLGATPVNADRTVQQMLGQGEQQQAANAGVIGLTEIQRQADPTRTVPVAMPGGGQQQYELPNADQLFQRFLNEKTQLHRGELENFSQRQQMDDASALNRQKQFFDYQQQVKRQMEAQQPTIDPRNPLGSGPIPMDQAGGVAALLRLMLPEYKMSTDYATGTPSFHSVDPITRQPIAVTDPNWKGSASPRPRQGSGAAGGPKPGDAAKFNKIEAQKRLALKNAEEDFRASGDAEKLNAAKTKAQRDYEKAIVGAGGSVSAPQQQAARPQSSAPVIAVNPQTGQRITLKDGKWVAM